jgi:hypothetical protein
MAKEINIYWVDLLIQAFENNILDNLFLELDINFGLNKTRTV